MVPARVYYGDSAIPSSFSGASVGSTSYYKKPSTDSKTARKKATVLSRSGGGGGGGGGGSGDGDEGGSKKRKRGGGGSSDGSNDSEGSGRRRDDREDEDEDEDEDAPRKKKSSKNGKVDTSKTAINKKNKKARSGGEAAADPAGNQAQPTSTNITDSGSTKSRLNLADFDPESLREKLRNKIQELSVKRSAPENPEEAPGAPKIRKKDKKKDKEGKKPQAQQQQQQQRKGGPSTATATTTTTSSSSTSTTTTSSSAAAAAGAAAAAAAASAASSESSRAAVATAAVNLTFSKFEFTPTTVGTNKIKELGAMPYDVKIKTKKQLLREAEKKQEHLRELKAAGNDAELKKIAFADALVRASGAKVKDNPALLKKSLKAEANKKKKSAKDWAQRTHMLKKTMSEKLSRRHENISKRKQGLPTISSKPQRPESSAEGTPGKDSKPKPKSRPGFEGAKKNFLNAKK
jgi:hypothetical protein